MQKANIILVGLHNSPSHPDYCANPFTSNVLAVANMLNKYDCYDIKHFGPEGSIMPDNVEHVDVLKQSLLDKSFGDNWRTQQDLPDTSGDNIAARSFNINAEFAIREHYGIDEDMPNILINFAGAGQRELCDNLTEKINAIVIEGYFGYDVCFSRCRVFPSIAWQNYNYGVFNREYEEFTRDWTEEDKMDMSRIPVNATPLWHCKMEDDAVIPHSIDIRRFEYQKEKRNFLLYAGRIVPSKGIEAMVNASRSLGLTLKIAGPGDYREAMGSNPPNHVEILGTLKGKELSDAMGQARAFLYYTQYIEPFGLAPIEANACGTPAITSNYGAFQETISNGVNGFRANNEEELRDYIQRSAEISTEKCRRHVENNYSYKAVAPAYHSYIQRIINKYAN